MNPQDKTLGLLGLARRAGKISYGSEGAISDIKKHKTKLIIFAGDISERTKNEILKNSGEIPVINLNVSKEILGNAIGTKPTVTLSVNDSNFKKGILEVK